jgi:hypothetical protein
MAEKKCTGCQTMVDMSDAKWSFDGKMNVLEKNCPKCKKLIKQYQRVKREVPQTPASLNYHW